MNDLSTITTAATAFLVVVVMTGAVAAGAVVHLAVAAYGSARSPKPVARRVGSRVVPATFAPQVDGQE
ncbi:hypothetical protein [Nocardioides sp.]|uniref:hypothetical protein n=1 Tax=Nocardioides sp. TaxID=35761 RepID=UPI003784D60F